MMAGGHSLRTAAVVCLAVALSHAYDLDDPKADHTSYAIEMDEAGDMGEPGGEGLDEGFSGAGLGPHDAVRAL